MIVSLRRDWDRIFVRLSVYSFAMVMDGIMSSLIFVCTVRMAEVTGSSVATGGLMAVWAGVYMVTSLLAGRLVTRRNVGWLLAGSCLAVGLLSGAYVRWPGLQAMYVITALQGVATAFFFTPFQVFMKLVDEGQNKGVARSSGLYVASWSLGYALGPFVAGALWKHGWQICHLVNAVASLAMTIGVVLLKHHADAKPRGGFPVVDAREPVLEQNADAPLLGGQDARLPDLAWMAWVFSGLGCMLTSMIRSHFPVSGQFFAISKLNQGVTLFLMCLVQAGVGFLLGWGRTWMYRPWPILGFGLFGSLGLAIFAVGHGVEQFWPAAICVGVWSGSFYFYFVYHSLIHPTKSAHYVSINEAVVGVGGVAGPALGGVLADRVGLAVPYVVGAGIVLIAICVQAMLHRTYNHRAANASLLAAGAYDTVHGQHQDKTRVDRGIR